jgi:hypothetical protein
MEDSMRKALVPLIALALLLSLSCASTGSAKATAPAANKSASASTAETAPAAKNASDSGAKKPPRVKRTVESVPVGDRDSSLAMADLKRQEKVTELAKKFVASKDKTVMMLGLLMLINSSSVMTLTENRNTASGGEQYEAAQNYRKAIDEMISTTKADKLLAALVKVKAFNDEIMYLPEGTPAPVDAAAAPVADAAAADPAKTE